MQKRKNTDITPDDSEEDDAVNKLRQQIQENNITGVKNVLKMRNVKSSYDPPLSPGIDRPKT